MRTTGCYLSGDFVGSFVPHPSASLKGGAPGVWVVLALLGLTCSGCILHKPTLFPVAPLSVEATDGGGLLRAFDTTGDGSADFGEVLSPEGRVVELGFGPTDGHTFPDLVSRESTDVPRCRRVLIILDSIPFQLVEDAYASGRFRNFYPPSRVISPFPVMTDLCLNEFYGVSPATAAETEYFDGQRLLDGWGGYTESDNSKWLEFADVQLPFSSHGNVYMDAANWFDHELALIEEALVEGDCGETTGYVVSTSALGIAGGRDGHLTGLVRLDRFCQSLMHRFRGEIEITLMSDHGHNLEDSQRLDLRVVAEAMGYSVRERLDGPGDVVIPAFGLVSTASAYTESPERFAKDIASAEGVELVAYRIDKGVVGVVDRSGAGIVSKAGNAYRYEVLRGDPLRIADVIETARREGLADSGGYISDAVLRERLADAYYPDAMYRLCRAFDGLMTHPGQVMVSIADGWYAGSPFMSNFLKAKAIHGGLNANDSYAFAMTTAGPLPQTLRMDALLAHLKRVGAIQSETTQSATTRGPGNGVPVK